MPGVNSGPISDAKAKAPADPCGMTTRKANAKANTGVLRLRAARFAQDDGVELKAPVEMRLLG
jgi:hypothetical protein